MNKVRKNKKKGFTLVELMIVVVIMIILAAAATPIFKGYVDRAKEAGYLANCRTVYVATQTVIQDYDIADKTITSPVIIKEKYQKDVVEAFTDPANDIQKLAQVEASANETYTITIKNKVCTEIRYQKDSTVVVFSPETSSLTTGESE